MFRERVHDSPAELAAGDFAFRLIEPEFAFRLGADLPARDAAYDREEVGRAVASLHPAFEVVTSAYGAAWTGLSAPALVADNAVHGAFVPGPATRSAPTSARSARSSCGSPDEARVGRRKDPTRAPLICPGAGGTLWHIPGPSPESLAMLIKVRRGWELPESAATPEHIFRDRRRLLKAAAAGPILLAVPGILAGCGEAPDRADQATQVAPETQVAGAGTSDATAAADPSAHLYPGARNLRYRLDREITPAELATTYNNYYEFGSSKNIWKKAQALPIRPWMVKIAGLVEKPFEIGIDELLDKMPL